jgi:hypothetical protein
MRRLTVLILAAVVAAAAAAGSATQTRRAAARCTDAGDRKTKLTLVEHLETGPQLLILGSSRARLAEPSLVERLTGRRGFNAGVSGGTAGDAWVFTRFMADRFPKEHRAYIWFVDTGIATTGLNAALRADPRALKYLPANVKRAPDVCPLASRYLADGSLAHFNHRSRAERARKVAKSLAKLLAHIRAHHPKPLPFNPRKYRYFERTLEYMNEAGSRPVIVLNPIYPRVLAELQKYGNPKRKAALAYLKRLHRTRDFVVVDCENIRAWGGSADEFENATHVDRTNMRRMLRYIVAKSDGALG